MKSFKSVLLFNAVASICLVTVIAVSLLLASNVFAHVHHVHDEHKVSVIAQNDYTSLSLIELATKVRGIQYVTAESISVDALHYALHNLHTETLADEALRLTLIARLEQHDHNFVKAKETLDDAAKHARADVNAQLLNASVLNNLGQHVEALNVCKQLLGVADAVTVAACVLETKAQISPEDTGKYYADLVKMVSMNDVSNLSQRFWVDEILAELAFKSAQSTLAAEHLNSDLLNQAPLSYIALWADIQLSLDNHQVVLEQLTALTQAHSEIDDALLLRLAMAEKQSGAGTRWLNAMSQRIKARSDQHNYSHAAELARFYLYVEINPQQATYWAKINLEHAKSHMDLSLLAAAESLQSETSD